MESQPSGVDIKNKGNNLTAPTPQNTPISPAPITSSYNPSMNAISEDTEIANASSTQGDSSALAGAFASNPALLSMLQGKLGTLVGRSSGYIESLPAIVKRRLFGLKHLQSKHAELESQFQEEVLALEKKYLELYKPLYQQRAQIVNGQYEPTDEEVALGRQVEEEEEEEEEEETSGDTDVKGVPEFWLTLLKNHPQIMETITERDEEALKHLVDVRLSYMDQPGFKLEFEFTENEFFTNRVLDKTYYYQDHVYGGDFVYDHADGCSVDWKEGKDLTVTVEAKKQRQKGTNKSRVVKRTVPTNSFFHFFSPPTIPEEDDVEEEDADDLDAKLEADYEMGEEFKDKIIPHAVDYFTGKALDLDDYEGDDFEDEFYDEDEIDEDEDEHDDDDDDDDDDTAPAQSEKAPECKQS